MDAELKAPPFELRPVGEAGQAWMVTVITSLLSLAKAVDKKARIERKVMNVLGKINHMVNECIKRVYRETSRNAVLTSGRVRS